MNALVVIKPGYKVPPVTLPRGVPGTVVKPVQKLVKRIVDEIFGSPIIEPGVEFMDNRLKFDDCKQT